ncbi:MAG: phytanoyl-CoA dioxygenase family protein [Verrucomicrobiales bacterium]|nr:phytanoyl-CoA dioxygenase family protein [Verrucomicrobiales bacterium]
MTASELLQTRDQLHTEFDQDGYVSIPGFFDPDEIEAIRENNERYIRDIVPKMPETEVYYDDKDDPDTLKQLQNMGKHDPFFGSLLEADSKLSQLAEACLGEAVEARNLQYFNKSPKVSTPTPPHQDGYYFHLTPNLAVTMWIALEDVTPEQGCVNYVRGSHRYGMRAHGKSGTLGFSQGILDFGIPNDLENQQSFPCQAGHVLAHHSFVIHWADANTSGDKSRQALGAVYFAERCEIDQSARAAYQARLDAELKSAGKI